MNLPNCVIPIHRELGGRRLESFGSGVLLRILEYRILTSVAHVLLSDNLLLPGKPGFVPLDEAGRIITTSPSLAAAQNDPADVGYVVLNKGAVDALTVQGSEFLSVAQTTFGKPFPEPTHWIFSGYPWRKSNDRVPGQIESTRMDVHERIIPDGEMAAFGCDPKLHVAMHYPRKKMYHEQVRVTGALPHGMSGGAVWHVGSDGVPILVAIATNYDAGKKFMRATRVNPLLFRVRDHRRADIAKKGIEPNGA